ncbi:FkbM family methyltransferase [Trichormus sp. NMC-1]|uniref:FkbM family methyltransferase n=1 Tax=Trichormus sp. NMC-1 TaxID=1853259 RepID=UPI0015A517E0|nr:FkbM family methyltransferase [Trichormus sp. NMC-1]
MSTKELVRKILPPSAIIHLMAAMNYRNGEPELKLLKSLVDPKKNSIDIGANKGVYTYFLSRLSHHVFAYEPNPELAEFIIKSVSSNVSVYSIALSNREGQAILSVPLVDNFLYDQLGTLEEKATYQKGTIYEVPLKRLDNQGHRNIGFIKIDVEGHEESVIDGAYNLLITQRPNLLIEIEQKHHPDQDISDIFFKILKLGYEGYFFMNEELKSLEKFSPEKHQDIRNYAGLSSLGKTYICNFIFKPR